MLDLHAQPVNTSDDLKRAIEKGELKIEGDTILLLGAGNIIMADEGIGPLALKYLHEHFDFPVNVGLLDVATTGMGMLSNLEGFDHLVIIDATDNSGHPPGTVIFYTPEDLGQQQVMHTAHDQRLTDVLFAAALTGIELKSVKIVGVQIQSMEQFVLELSPPVQEALPIACAAALHCLRDLGFESTAKAGVEVDARLMDALQNYAPEEEFAESEKA